MNKYLRFRLSDKNKLLLNGRRKRNGQFAMQCNINMNQKQNNKFVLGRLYPEYFKPAEPSKEQSESVVKNVRSKQERKIQTKLRSIIYNLQKDIQQQLIISKQFEQPVESRLNSKNSMRSFSHKSLGHRPRNQRYKTQIQPSVNERTQRFHSKSKIRKNTESRQSEDLILPKLNLKNRSIDQEQRRKLFQKKKNKKLEMLQLQEKQLGKIVLQKVEKHFEMERDGEKHYFEKIKSEKGIDQSLITYLRNKLNKANVALLT